MWTLHIFKIILHIQMSLVRNFSSNNFDFLDQICPKKYFQSKTEKFQNFQVQNFNLNWYFWAFGPNLCKKRYFQSKKEQAVQGLQVFTFYVVKINSRVVFKHFEDHKDLIILSILKEKLVMSCLLGSFHLNIF